jgi:hypothetical protein
LTGGEAVRVLSTVFTETIKSSAGRYRGQGWPPKTTSSVRDIDLMLPATEALKTQKAQQAAERLKGGRGAPKPGQDCVFTGPAGGS